jgi:hypothetical protein
MTYCEFCDTHGWPGGKGIRCKNYREDGDVVSRRCVCNKYPGCGFLEGPTLRCKGCVKPGMVPKKKVRPCVVCGKQSLLLHIIRFKPDRYISASGTKNPLVSTSALRV